MGKNDIPSQMHSTGEFKNPYSQVMKVAFLI
jgi:hypothetical protein